MAIPNPCTSLAADLAGSLDPVVYARHQLPRSLPALDQWQEDAARDRSSGLLLLCGRQTGKSTLAALLAVWQASTWPDQLILLISPTQRQSSELFRKTMVLFDESSHRPEAIRRTQTEVELSNGGKIFSLPGANPDAVRGFSRPDLIIEDEAAFVNDKTFIATRPMLATNPYGRHVLLTTPYGRRGHFFTLWNDDDPSWRRITIWASDCPRISRAFLEGERRVLSERAYQQEYECNFLEAATSVFPSDWIERLVDGDERHNETLPDQLPGIALPTVAPGPWEAVR